MSRRCPGAKVLGTCWLRGVRLHFGGPSKMWKGGVATLASSDEPSSGVPGLLYQVDPSHIAQLDRYEGHPYFYVRQTIEVEFDESSTSALTYLLKEDIPSHPPAPAYLEAILRAYDHHGWDTTDLHAIHT